MLLTRVLFLSCALIHSCQVVFYFALKNEFQAILNQSFDSKNFVFLTHFYSFAVIVNWYTKAEQKVVKLLIFMQGDNV